MPPEQTQAAPSPSAPLTVSQKAQLTAGATMWTTRAVPEAGIPSLTLADGPMGIASGRVDERDVSLLTPSGVALGATWDVDLVRRIGALVGGEATRRGVDMVLAPNVNLPRSPLAGRAFELFSEDPFLTGALGTAWATGLQSMGVGAVVKHLVCNDSETQRNSMNAVVSEAALREVYLLPFEMAAAAGCGGLLTAYNRVNGQWCSEHSHILQTIVKQEWAWPGLTVSDWFGTQSTLGSARGGLDLEMPGPARFLGEKFGEAVDRGEVDAARLDDAVDRLARTARRFSGTKPPPLPDDAAQALLEDAAAAGFTLLRNEGDLLPLTPGTDRVIAVIGPNATAPCFQGGTFAKIAVRPDALTPLDAIRARFGATADILYEPGVDPQPRLPSMPARPARDLGDGCTAGMTLDYFDNPDLSGEPVGSETRNTNVLTWFVGMHDNGVWTHPAAVRASGRVRAEVSGPHQFHVGATGSVRLLIDGVEVFARERTIAPGDIMGVLKAGDADWVTHELQAGQEVLVTVEFTYQVARAHGVWYGVRAPDDPDAMRRRAVAAAAKADVVLLIVGETADSGVESRDRTTTALDPAQVALIEAVTAANPRTAIIANVGHAFDTSWDDKAAALMVCWYPGEAFAPALAAVLAGDREPGGRMPVTIAARDADYPAFDLTPDAQGDLVYAEGSEIGYRSFAARGLAPRHALGAGFGYARFDWSDPAVTRVDGGYEVAVTVQNTSARHGSDLVQVYLTAPRFALAGFARVELAAGERRRVVVAVADRRLMVWREGWVRPDGAHTLALSRSAVDPVFTLELEPASL